MNSKKFIAVIAAINILIIAVSAYFYTVLPDVIASHWDAAGQANGYSSKFWGLFLLPLISIAVTLLLLFIPRLDPLKANVEKFKGTYYGFIIAFLGFFSYLHVLTIIYNRGYKFDMTQFLIPGFALLFYFIGSMIGKAKRNYFIGIRTPWTLASDVVWNKTHELGGKLFRLAAILSLIGIFIPQYGIWFLMVPVFGVSIITVVYSYLIFRQQPTA
jgi:uncharacterized membrane protein